MITLTTDFGYMDHYIGAMKGVILKINPQARIIDITHSIRRHDIRHAAYVLNAILPYFKNAVHVFVVDPGVGTSRKGIAVRFGDSWYVGPDNGIITYVADRIDDVYEIQLEPKSTTFHGRDVFAPAGAYIDMGRSDGILRKIKNVHLFSYHPPVKNGDTLEGEIIHMDRFGNVVTNIPGSMVGRPAYVEVFGMRLRFLPSYGFAKRGELIALINSENFLEFAVNQGDASTKLPCSVGDRVEVRVQH